MPWLAAFLTSILTKVFDFFAYKFTWRVALFATLITVLTTMTVTFFAAIKALVAAIYVVMPPDICSTWGWFIPDNFVPCLSAYASAAMLRWAFFQNRAMLLYRFNSVSR